jgi:hypothetical protein
MRSAADKPIIAPPSRDSIGVKFAQSTTIVCHPVFVFSCRFTEYFASIFLTSPSALEPAFAASTPFTR